MKSKYLELTSFKNAISINNVVLIKDELISFIKFFHNDLEEFNKALKYAIENSDFKYEIHKDLELNETSTALDIFESEYLNLYSNFSEKRVKKVIELLPNWKSSQSNIISDNYDILESNIDLSSKNNILKNIIIAIIAIISLFIIYNLI